MENKLKNSLIVVKFKTIKLKTKLNCLHTHILIKIPHRSKIKINYDKLYDIFKQKINKLFNNDKNIHK